MFADRVDAGRALAVALRHLSGEAVVVLGLPRGGVVVAAEVARSLGAPLDVVVVRKLGVPGHRELAMGAIGEGGARVLNEDVLRRGRIDPADLQLVEEHERSELEARVRLLRRGRARIDVTDRTAVLVDDGIATGATIEVGCLVARQLGAARVVVAVPVAPPGTARRLVGADEVVCVTMPEHFTAVGTSYADFSQTTDDEVVRLLDEAAARMSRGGASG